jgi:hypothetical protein
VDPYHLILDSDNDNWLDFLLSFVVNLTCVHLITLLKTKIEDEPVYYQERVVNLYAQILNS